MSMSSGWLNGGWDFVTTVRTTNPWAWEHRVGRDINARLRGVVRLLICDSCGKRDADESLFAVYHQRLHFCSEDCEAKWISDHTVTGSITRTYTNNTYTNTYTNNWNNWVVK